MKKLLSTLFCCCCLYAMAFAQQPLKLLTVKGVIIDSAGNTPMGFVTVALQDAATKKPVKSNLTKDDGSFELKAPEGKSYQLALVFIGYKSKLITVPATASPIDMGKILLSPSVNQLKEVAISAARPLMKQEVDRISYDVQADPEAKSVDALDMIRKVPLLTVDGSDNIKLKGSGNYKILINGKESALMAKSPSDVLKSMPATNIQKIEVITTPPAKYDAEGLAGIINIVTKKNAIQGYNGTLNSRLNSVYGLGTNLNLSVKEGKLGITMFGGYSNNSGQKTLFNSTQTFLGNQSVLAQSGSSAGKGHNFYYNAELSYDLDSLNLLTASIQSFNGVDRNQGDQFSSMASNVGKVNQAYLLNNIGNNTFQGMDASINYQLGFKRNKDQLLTMSYKFSYSPNSQLTNNTIFDRVSYPFPDYNQINTSGNREHTFQLDYAHPLKVVSIEAGAKAIIRNNFSNFQSDSLNTKTNTFVPNSSQTNQFSYHQDVVSFYNSYSVKMDQWTAKAGLRLEHTNIDANFISAGSSASQNYNNFIPSVSILRSFKGSSINVGFTQRIQRPGIFQLNPFVDRSNPNFINTGNPALKPELNNTFELSYSNFKKNSITLGLSYAFSNNSIQNVTSLSQQVTNGKTDTITTTTFRNLGSNNTLGFSINTNYPITKQLQINVNGQLSRVGLKGTYNGQFYTNSGYTGNVFANLSYKFNGGYRFGIDAGYFSGDVNLQGKSGNFIYTSNLLAKTFYKNKATISAVVNNPYGKFWSQKSSTATPDFLQSSLNQQTYRTFAVRFNYRFGKLNSEIRKNQHGISNDDTKGGGNKSGSN